MIVQPKDDLFRRRRNHGLRVPSYLRGLDVRPNLQEPGAQAGQRDQLLIGEQAVGLNPLLVVKQVEG